MSVVKNQTATDILWMFAKTYRLEDGRFVNKVGEEASQRTLDFVAEAQAFLADAR